MKTSLKLLPILVVMLTFSCTSQRQISAQSGTVSLQVFYDQLSPYGQWVDYGNYGYVWMPDVSSDFEPYSTSGYWVMTDYGWTWASDYDWGWAAFHYGRWDFDNSYGWFWVPGNEWGPSWVMWRQTEGYYGWSPMRPGINISMSFNNGYRENDHWNFVRDRDFGRTNIHQYYVDRSSYSSFVGRTTVINNTSVDRGRKSTYVAGPRRADVQRTTGRSINNVVITNSDRPGQRLQNNQMQIYRPQVQQNNASNRRSTPNTVTKLNEVKPPKDRSVSPQPNRNNRNINRNEQQPNQQKDIIRQPQQRPIQTQPVREPEQQRQQPVQQPEQQRQQPVRQAEPQRQQPVQSQPEPQRQQPEPQKREQQPEPQRQQPTPQPEPQRQPPQQPDRQNQPNQQPGRRGEQSSVQPQKSDQKDAPSVNQNVRKAQKATPDKVSEPKPNDNNSRTK